MEELQYPLKRPFEYAHNGDMRTAQFITLTPPNVQNLGHVAKLKQGFMRAATKGGLDDSLPKGKKVKERAPDDLTGDDIILMLTMSDIDYAGYLIIAKTLFTDKKLAMIDGEQTLKPLIDNLSTEDLESMTGEYLRAFILTSVLKKMQT